MYLGRTYVVLENGKEIFSGTKKEVATFLDISFHALLKAYQRKTLINKRYSIAARPPRVQKNKLKQELYYNYLYEHLEVFGNTVSKEKPKNTVMERLKKDLNCDISIEKEEIVITDEEHAFSYKRNARKHYYYILRLVH